MKIAVNIDKLSRTNKRGVSVYIYQVIKELSEVDKKNDYILYSRHDFEDKPFVKNPRFSLKVLKSDLGLLYWTFIQLPRQVLADKPDLFFSPAQNYPFISVKPDGIKTVTTVLDVAYRLFPKYFDLKYRIGFDMNTKIAVSRSNRVISISESTKSDIIKYYKTDPEKIDVIYLSSRMNELNSDQDKAGLCKKFSIRMPYLLFVGAVQPRKNIARLVEAFEIAKEKDNSLNLVICGEDGWLSEKIYNKIKTSKFKNDIMLTGGVSEKDLASLYKNSLMFILPSLYEGFGIPVLEAMSMGIPVIIPKNSSFPEIAGVAGIYINEYDKNDIADKIIMLAHDRRLRSELSELGKARAKVFSWRACAEKHLAVFESFISH